MDSYIPHGTRHISNPKSWFNQECNRAVRAKNIAYRLWCELPTIAHREAFVHARNTCSRTIELAKESHDTRICNKLANTPPGSKTVWFLAKAIDKNFTSSYLPPCERSNGTTAVSSKEKADLLAHMFSSNPRYHWECSVTVKREREKGYVRMCTILDALGVSNPNPRRLNFEKITMEPRGALSDDHLPTFSSRQSSFGSYFGNIKLKNIENVEKNRHFLGSALNNLEIAKKSVGANNLKDFIVKMKSKFYTCLDNSNLQKRLPVYRAPKPPKNTLGYSKNPARNQNNLGSIPIKTNSTLEESKKENAETVGVSFIPNELTYPHLDQPSKTQLGQFVQSNAQSTRTNQHNAEKDLDTVLGAVNPMMFERIFKERLQNNERKVTPQTVFHNDRMTKQLENHFPNDGDRLSTSFAIKGQILKPFMGQATSKNKNDFFSKFKPETDKEDSANTKFENEYLDYESIENSTWE
ncbi:hypothetical protein JTB14_023868 [Gonioctena quinquepunctata]|nr:hypothetical protein JTB14_023868 [Gonioctena quinquepunctata]